MTLLLAALLPFGGAMAIVPAIALEFGQAGFQNGSFDSPGLPSGVTHWALDPAGSTFITGWATVPGYNATASGTVEYIGAWSQDPGGSCVELGYYFGTNAIEQTFSTAPNQPHLVSFWLATDPFNGPPAILRVSSAGTSNDYKAAPSSGDSRAMGWQQHSFMFTSDTTGSTTLWFGNVVGIPAIDTITVTELAEADSDDDGVPDAQDRCPGTAPGAIVDTNGCSIDQFCIPTPVRPGASGEAMPAKVIVGSGEVVLTVLRGESAAYNNLVGVASPIKQDLYFSKTLPKARIGYWIILPRIRN